MPLSETSWQAVGRALLGRWPNQVATWGEEGISAFVEELRAEGLTPDTALAGVRLHRSEFPPSVAAVSDNARRDPSLPTFEEAMGLIYGKGGVLRARIGPGMFGAPAEKQRAEESAMRRRAGELHPLIASFVDRFGIDRLRCLEVDHPLYGDLKRKELREAWERHCTAVEGRDVAALVSGRRGELAAFDPLAVLESSVPKQIVGAA